MKRALLTILMFGCTRTAVMAEVPSVSFVGDVMVSEGAGQAVFEVDVSGPHTFPLTINWETLDATATAGADYVADGGNVTVFGSGRFSIQVQVQDNDHVWESTETFLVRLFAPSGLTHDVANGAIKDARAKCDINGDGRSDVLVATGTPPPGTPGPWPIPGWHKGAIHDWVIGGGTVATPFGEFDVLKGWHLLATDNFGSSGGCGLLWQWVPQPGSPPQPFTPGTLALTTAAGAAFNEPQPSNFLTTAALPAAWRAVGSGQFTPDAHADLLWWNSLTGELHVRPWNGNGFGDALALPPGPDLNWEPEAVIDVDSDGDADIVWRNALSGALVYWQMDHLVHQGGGFFGPGALAAPCWQLVAAGDFNGDGSDDILWQNQVSQKSVLWLMQGAVKIGGGYLSPELFDTAEDPETIHKCPQSCTRDCSTKWWVKGPR